MTTAEKWLVWSSTAAVAGTGVVLGWMKYLLEPADPWAVIHHPLQPLVLKLHILTAPFLVFGIGAIALRHIWPHIRAGVRRGRRTGIIAAAVTIPMVLTGYLIQVVTHTGWLRAFVIAHLVTGTLFALGSLPHALVTRRRPLAGERAGADPGAGPAAPVSFRTAPLGRARTRAVT